MIWINLDVGIPVPGTLSHSQPCSRYFPMIYCNPNGAAEGNWQGWDRGGEGLVPLGVPECLAPTGSPTGAGFRSSRIGCAVPGGGGNDNKLNNNNNNSNKKLPMFPAIPGALFSVQISWRRGWFAFSFRRILNPGICWLFFRAPGSAELDGFFVDQVLPGAFQGSPELQGCPQWSGLFLGADMENSKAVVWNSSMPYPCVEE